MWSYLSIGNNIVPCFSFSMLVFVYRLVLIGMSVIRRPNRSALLEHDQDGPPNTMANKFEMRRYGLWTHDECMHISQFRIASYGTVMIRERSSNSSVLLY